MCGLLAAGAACTSGSDGSRGESDGGAVDAGLLDGAVPDGGEVDAGGDTLIDAPEAELAGRLELDEPLADVVYAEDLVLGLHAEEGVSILDLSDPKEPAVISFLPTTGRAVAVAFDARLRILFVITVSGDLRAYRVIDPSGPVQLAQLAVTEDGEAASDVQSMVRVGARLFILGASRLLPVAISFDGSGDLELAQGSDVELDGEPQRIATGGNVLFIGFANGVVQLWSTAASPAMVDATSLGGEIAGWVVRGRRVFAAIRGVGLRVLDLSATGRPRVLFSSSEFDDAEGLERHGNLVLIALSRGLLVALDLSDFSAPRALVTRRGVLPAWIASIQGNLLLGSGTTLSVFGVPPFVSASVPALSRDAFPRYGRIPLQLSKPVDPATVTSTSVRLRCNGDLIEGTVVVSLDRMRITFVPSSPLPAGQRCTLALEGVRDALGLRLSSVPDALQVTTMSEAPAPIENPHSSYPHTADGLFTDWEEDASEDFEYFDVTPARGMYSYFYADFDGEKLWLLNDWFYNGDDIDPDCYNQFGVWTGGGQNFWDIRAYGDQRIEVRLNGQLLEADDERVTGGYGYAGSPNDPEPHTIYELAIETEPGNWGVQLHDPGPTFSCHVLETDPTNYLGETGEDGSTVDPTQPPQMPAEPVLSTEPVIDVTPLLRWSTGDAPAQFVSFVFELGQGEDLDRVIYRVTVYGQYLVLPLGLLQEGMTYTWRVTAYTLAGSISSEPVTFTVGAPPEVEAPELESVEPSSVVQGEGGTLTITGSGFVEGARAYFGETELATTFMSSTQLVATLPAALTEAIGTYDLTVRNLPDDADTTSNVLEFNVTEPVSNLVTLVSLDPDTVTADSSTSVMVNMTNAPAGLYYLVLTPAGGGAEISTFCDWIGTNQCQAYVDVAEGVYDAHVQVGEGQTAYDTNVLEDGLTAEAPDGVTLVGLSPRTIPMSTARTLQVTMTNASAGSYYLVLTPAAGGDALEAVFCDWVNTTRCDATVNVATAGMYHAKLIVGTPGSGTDTNTVNNALTVSEPCAHSECLPGAALGAACSTCAIAVCDAMPSCCSGGWTAACAQAAAAHGSCSCSAPALVGLSPETQEDDDETDVTVDLTGAADGYEYTLMLTPSGQDTGESFVCQYSAGTGDCTAVVSGLAAGTYDARVQVRHGATMQAITTNLLESAFTVTEAGGGGGTCFEGGESATVSGSGTCSSPFVIDLSGDPLGTIKTHSNDNGDNESFGSGGSNCSWIGTARHDIYQVLLPAEADGFEVTVDAVSDANPRIAVLEDPSCGQPHNLCVDANGATECEYANAEKGPHFFGNTYFVVGLSDTGVTTTVRVRAY